MQWEWERSESWRVHIGRLCCCEPTDQETTVILLRPNSQSDCQLCATRPIDSIESRYNKSDNNNLINGRRKRQSLVIPCCRDAVLSHLFGRTGGVAIALYCVAHMVVTVANSSTFVTTSRLTESAEQ